MKGINTWAVPLERFSGQFLKLLRELQYINQILRDLLTMHKVLHPRDNANCMCQEKEEAHKLALR